MQEQTNVLLGKVCLVAKKWNTISTTKRLGIVFGALISLCIVMYFTLLTTINWQAKLCQATKNADLDKVKTSLFFGADVNTTTSFDGQVLRPVSIAIKNKQIDILRFLVQKGARLDYKLYNDDPKNWYHSSTEAVNTDDPRTIETFISLGGKITDCTSDGHNALTYAISLQKMTAIKVLAKHLDVNTADGNGLLPLTYAYTTRSKTKRTQMLDLLTSLGANADQQTRDGNTPLHQYLNLAQEIKDSYDTITDILGFIKKHSKKGIDAPNKQGMTPLMCAARRGKTKAFSALEWQGSSLYHTNKKGQTVFDILSKNGHDDLFNRYARKLKRIDSKAFKHLQKKFPKRLKNGRVPPPKRIAKAPRKYKPRRKKSTGFGKKLLRRFGPIGFFLSLF